MELPFIRHADYIVWIALAIGLTVGAVLFGAANPPRTVAEVEPWRPTIDPVANAEGLPGLRIKHGLGDFEVYQPLLLREDTPGSAEWGFLIYALSDEKIAIELDTPNGRFQLTTTHRIELGENPGD